MLDTRVVTGRKRGFVGMSADVHQPLVVIIS